MGVSQNQIYKYIKHLHMSRWKAFEFKHSREVFQPCTILSVVEFVDNFKFYPQIEIESYYYHSDQVSILVHVLYIHAQLNIDGRDSTDESRDVIKEYHFYINDDRENETLFLQHYFDLIYESSKRNGTSFRKHYIWSYGCAR